MSDESPSVDAKSRKLALDMMGDGPERELAEAIDNTRTGKELMASLLGNQAAAACALALRFYTMSNAFLDSAGPARLRAMAIATRCFPCVLPAPPYA